MASDKTKEEALKKWNEILNHANCNSRPFILGKCSFCSEFMAGNDCSDCPLYPKHCSNDKDDNPNSTIWKIHDLIFNGEYENAIPEIKIMIQAIKEA